MSSAPTTVPFADESGEDFRSGTKAHAMAGPIESVARYAPGAAGSQEKRWNG